MNMYTKYVFFVIKYILYLDVAKSAASNETPFVLFKSKVILKECDSFLLLLLKIIKPLKKIRPCLNYEFNWPRVAIRFK